MSDEITPPDPEWPLPVKMDGKIVGWAKLDGQGNVVGRMLPNTIIQSGQMHLSVFVPDPAEQVDWSIDVI